MKTSPFKKVKLVCGILYSNKEALQIGLEKLKLIYGPVDCSSPEWPFRITDYYRKEMGENLFRSFVSFEKLIRVETISGIKLYTNELEEIISREFGSKNRIINLDPGYLTEAALFMATAKDFSHRVALQNGIYAHLEFIFEKTGIRVLEWTYPDFMNPEYQKYFQSVRKKYREQLQ